MLPLKVQQDPGDDNHMVFVSVGDVRPLFGGSVMSSAEAALTAYYSMKSLFMLCNGFTMVIQCLPTELVDLYSLLPAVLCVNHCSLWMYCAPFHTVVF